MRGLLITKSFKEKVLDGGEYINKRNKEILKACCTKLDIIEIDKKVYNNQLEKLKNMLINKNFYGISLNEKKHIMKVLEKQKYDFCFIASSLVGCLVKDLKSVYPELKIIVFFHNVEYIYYKQLAEQSGLYKLILAFLARYNEKLSIKWADKIISLNQRDTENILKIYRRNVDLIIPTSFKNSYLEKYDEKKYINKKNKKILFVGSNFYANFHGIEWFIKNVLPYLNNVTLNIVGKGTEEWRKNFNDVKNLKIIGAVEDLKLYYLEADIVVLPIFLGSGMKTKTAEALMYGKYIYGTNEAFEGYEFDYDKIGGLCNSKEDFIEKINAHFKLIINNYNNYSRKIFLEKYDTQKWINVMNNFLNKM